MKRLPKMYLGQDFAHSKEGCCTRCGKRLDPATAVSLELDQRIDEYHDFGGVPAHSSQGGFDFGPDCAQALRYRARMAFAEVPAINPEAANPCNARYSSEKP